MKDFRERIAEILMPQKLYDKISNRYSTGGPIERSIKKRIGDMAHRKDAENALERCYDAVQATYEKIYSKNDTLQATYGDGA